MLDVMEVRSRFQQRMEMEDTNIPELSQKLDISYGALKNFLDGKVKPIASTYDKYYAYATGETPSEILSADTPEKSRGGASRGTDSQPDSSDLPESKPLSTNSNDETVQEEKESKPKKLSADKNNLDLQAQVEQLTEQMHKLTSAYTQTQIEIKQLKIEMLKRDINRLEETSHGF